MLKFLKEIAPTKQNRASPEAASHICGVFSFESLIQLRELYQAPGMCQACAGGCWVSILTVQVQTPCGNCSHTVPEVVSLQRGEWSPDGGDSKALGGDGISAGFLEVKCSWSCEQRPRGTSPWNPGSSREAWRCWDHKDSWVPPAEWQLPEGHGELRSAPSLVPSTLAAAPVLGNVCWSDCSPPHRGVECFMAVLEAWFPELSECTGEWQGVKGQGSKMDSQGTHSGLFWGQSLTFPKPGHFLSTCMRLKNPGPRTFCWP